MKYLEVRGNAVVNSNNSWIGSVQYQVATAPY